MFSYASGKEREEMHYSQNESTTPRSEKYSRINLVKVYLP
jgi:hypothetical protein